jgi:PadR family transcriptional regulator, regulatory protein PadR
MTPTHDRQQVRLSIQSLRLLAIMLRRGDDPQYGLDLASVLDMPSGTLYPLLSRLEVAGWLKSTWEQIDPVAEGRPPRRYYRLTARGKKAAQGALSELTGIQP